MKTVKFEAIQWLAPTGDCRGAREGAEPDCGCPGCACPKPAHEHGREPR